jgi:zinc-binding alcohol dehydrogenase/oxidoreductase
MKGLFLEEKGKFPAYVVLPDPQPEADQVVVDLKAASLNRRELWMVKGLYPGLRFPVIPGSDGAGVYQGRDVVINPSVDWGDNPAYSGKDYQILGMPADGTFAEKIAIRKDLLHDKPPHLSFEEAAALPLGGLTAFRSIHTKGQTQKGDKVLITGVGGGVAVLAFQFAMALGAEVYVTSGSDAKLEKARKMGAAGVANYKDPEWYKSLKAKAGAFDVIIDSAGGDGFAHLVNLINYGGRIAIYGGTVGQASFSPQRLFWRQASIHGTSMGTAGEFEAMLQLVTDHKIVPAVDMVFPLSDGAQAYQRMADGQQFGKIVLTIGE